MKGLFSILVGLDLSPDGEDLSVGSRRAARQAQWLASKTGASLTFLHSTFADAVVYDDPSGRPHLRPGVPAAAQAAMDKLVSDMSESGLKCELVTCEGRPWMEIIRRVKAGKEDLVMVGMRNRNGRRGANVGSVAMKLLRKCPVPVWVVHPRQELEHQCIVAATELGPVGALAVEYGAYVARENNCDFHVVHAYQIPLQLQMSCSHMTGEEYEQKLAELAETARKGAESQLADAGGEGRVHVGWNSPSHLILEAVEQLDADLLVMGTLTAPGPAGLLLGSTAEHLLARLDCSLLGIKPEGFVSPVQ